jgi:tetratricopeptide (TPR) repeat protein
MALKKATEADDTGTEATSDGGVVDEEAARVAVDAYEHLLVLVGDSIEVGTLKNTIAAYMALDEIDAAIDFSDRALQQIPDSASLWSVRADALARAERYPEAAEAMNRVLTLDPAYPNAYLRRGMFKLREGDESGAVSDFREAIAAGSDPNTIASQLLARGYQDYFQKAQYRGAIGLFTTGLEFATSAEMKQQLAFFTGAAYFQQGVGLDESNNAEGCAPAQRALDSFQKALPYMNQAGSYQSANKAQIVESTDVYIYRQQQIIRKACG